MPLDGGFVWTGSLCGLDITSLIEVLMGEEGGRAFERLLGGADVPRGNGGGNPAETHAINTLRALVYAERMDGRMGVQEKLTVVREIRNITFLRKNWHSAISFFFEDVDPGKIARNITSPDEALWLYGLSRSIIRVTSVTGCCYLDRLSQALRIRDAEKSEFERRAGLLRKNFTRERN